MPINKIKPSNRAKSAIAAALIAATAGAGGYAVTNSPTPPAVVLATNSLIKPWEGLRPSAYQDSVKVWTVCWGETRINGKPVQKGMTFTRKQCDDMLDRRLYSDYYLPLVKRIPEFDELPPSLQASLLSGAYNFGVDGQLNSTQVRLARAGKYREACEAQTAWNKAKGIVLKGLVNRREMGDAQRIGEAELCVSGL